MLLTLEKVKEFAHSGINVIVVDNYLQTTKQTERLKKIERYMRSTYPDIHFVVQFDRNLNEIKLNRGGRVKNDKYTMSDIIQKDAQLDNNYPCFRPFSSLTTTTDGRIGMCCYDVYFDLCIGNVEDRNVLDTYHNDKATKIRLELLRCNRSFAKCCDWCDTFYLHDFELRKEGLSKREMESD